MAPELDQYVLISNFTPVSMIELMLNRDFMAHEATRLNVAFNREAWGSTVVYPQIPQQVCLSLAVCKSVC